LKESLSIAGAGGQGEGRQPEAFNLTLPAWCFLGAALLTLVLHSTCLDAKYFSISTAAVPQKLIRAIRPVERGMC